MTIAGRLSAVALLTSVVSAVGGVGLSLTGMQEASFPHDAHEGLFPLCTGCHEGVPQGETPEFYPEPASCTGCHDGVNRETVAWDGPSEEISNVSFDHAAHDRALSADGDPAQTCASCHVEAGAGRMAVRDSIQLGTCWSCHAHVATDHQLDADCTTCHVPLAETDFDEGRIRALRRPADHRARSWVLLDHGPTAEGGVARCATCHTQERCVACHVDTDRRPIEAMPRAPAGMELPPARARYPEPATHASDAWLSSHAAQASRDSCATCHTSDDCASCHVAPAPDVIASLPSRDGVLAPGVVLSARAPDSHERAFFMRAHPVLAETDAGSCATCHRESFCTECHDAPIGGGYHPANFVSRHAGESFGRDTECSNCHNAQVFCRECHVQNGLVNTAGRLNAGYHNGGPIWLLRHGQAARQTLESCASCHKQVDCTQCHGVLGAFKVSPHSADFDAARAWARSPRTCLACHIGNPINGNEP
jgi:hypothetical protein